MSWKHPVKAITTGCGGETVERKDATLGACSAQCHLPGRHLPISQSWARQGRGISLPIPFSNSALLPMNFSEVLLKSSLWQLTTWRNSLQTANVASLILLLTPSHWWWCWIKKELGWSGRGLWVPMHSAGYPSSGWLFRNAHHAWRASLLFQTRASGNSEPCSEGLSTHLGLKTEHLLLRRLM